MPKSCTVRVAIICSATFGLLIFLAYPSLVSAASGGDAEPVAVGLFEAMDAGDVDVRLVVRNGAEARMIAKNNTKKPLRIQLPEAFAAVPVLAQNQGGGGGFGGGGGGGGAFNVPPEKVAKLDVGFLCLEHGKPDPRSTMKYEIQPVENITTDSRVVAVLKQFGAGNFGHDAAQAAVWHLANKMSWRELAAKRRRRLGGINESYFTPLEMRQATNIVAHVASVAGKNVTTNESQAE